MVMRGLLKRLFPPSEQVASRLYEEQAAKSQPTGENADLATEEVSNRTSYSLDETDDGLLIVAVPSLVSILLSCEREKGSPLTEQEVWAIRDGAESIAMPRDVAAAVAEKRGYDDIDPENAWDDWNAIRPTLNI